MNMKLPKLSFLLLLSSLNLLFLSSCNKEFKSSDYRAYFGGEVKNPTNRFVYFSKDGVVIDTIPLQKDNTFFVQFDSLAPGMYTFKHDPEYQYVYFDKNDSIMVHINSKDFDESVVFCGRGDEKNNFLMELYLRNEKDKNDMFKVFDYDVPEFTKTIDSAYSKNLTFHVKIIFWNYTYYNQYHYIFSDHNNMGTNTHLTHYYK